MTDYHKSTNPQSLKQDNKIAENEPDLVDWILPLRPSEREKRNDKGQKRKKRKVDNKIFLFATYLKRAKDC